MTAAKAAVRVRIGTLRVTAASAIEARRLAEALPAAIERALAAWPGEPVERARSVGTITRRPEHVADHVADQIVRAARAALDSGGGSR
ncbi:MULTISPECIES: hypothetical protein [unclassified Micromonospora]|uniref:hypothetical protein n=1 Tax=unclassified Micromonospora TaxID=2617518 RepID=UPI002FF21592